VRRSLQACIVTVLGAHAALGALALKELTIPEARPARRGTTTFELVTGGPTGLAAPGSTSPEAEAVQATVSAVPLAASPRRSPASAPGLSRSKQGDVRPTPAVQGLASEVFRSPAEIDFPIRPRSAPDTTMIEHLPWSGLPMRLRLFVDAQGIVVDVTVLHSVDDPEVVERVRRMFLATAFVPARLNGVDVASYKDIELTVGGSR
jgi:hypothetical protein